MHYHLNVYDYGQYFLVGRGILRPTATGVLGTIFIHGKAVECELLMKETGLNAEEFLQKLDAARQALSSSLTADKSTLRSDR